MKATAVQPMHQAKAVPAAVPMEDMRPAHASLRGLQRMAAISPAAMQLQGYAQAMAGHALPLQKKIKASKEDYEYRDADHAYDALHTTFADIPEPALRKILGEMDAENMIFIDFRNLKHEVQKRASKELYALPHLWIKSGGLADLQDKMQGQVVLWPELSAELVEYCAAHQDQLASGLLDCGKLTIPAAGNATPECLAPGASHVPDELRTRVANFLMGFMNGNGQLDYVRSQKWFARQTYKAVVEMNFYPERDFTADNVYLGPHKDTDSRNLFVNLVFNNASVMPNTEWTMDELPPDQQRAAELDQYLPAGEISSIKAAKEQMKRLPADTPGRSNWEGGTVKPYGYASWVDELIWHSTPGLQPRPRYDRGLVCDWLLNDPGDFAPLLYEAMLIVSENRGGKIVANLDWLKNSLVDLDAWLAVAPNIRSSAEPGWLYMRGLIQEEIMAINWTDHKMTGGAGGVEKNLGTGVITRNRMVPTGTGGRPRSNSTNPEIMRQNQETLSAMKGGDDSAELPKRSFIRSWVTLVKNV